MPDFSAMLLLWLVLLIGFVVVEALTAQLTTIWFALGAVGAIIAYMCSAEVWVQWVVFTLVSLVALIATRPFVKKLSHNKKERTNADMVVGETAIVEETINNQLAQGIVKVKGAVWTARSSSGEIIEKGETVLVERIDGVKLMVIKK